MQGVWAAVLSITPSQFQTVRDYTKFLRKIKLTYIGNMRNTSSIIKGKACT